MSHSTHSSDAREFLKQFRERNNLTQREAAKAVGVTTTAWARWEQGKRRPSELVLNLVHIIELLQQVIENPDIIHTQTFTAFFTSKFREYFLTLSK
jgi:transcriptional regulator with XRE-family HTH domain